MNEGTHDNYYWIELPGDNFDIGHLIKNYPEVLLGKYLAIICFDSGPIKLSDEEKSAGWFEKNSVVFSPKITKGNIDSLFYAHYDQWCLFNSNPDNFHMTDFVNHKGFSLKQGNQVGNFWREVETIKPTNVITAGDNFIFVSDNQNEIAIIRGTGC